MHDARIFLPELDTVRSILFEEGAELKGDYKIHDTIYQSKNPEEGLDKVFLRLREVPLNIWDEKPVIVAIKNTELKDIGKVSMIPVKEQFDIKQDGLEFIKENYLNDYEYSYEFDRSGEQWFLVEDIIDLENIQGHFSVEFKSKTEEGLRRLLNIFGIDEEEIIKGPSVVEIKKLIS